MNNLKNAKCKHKIFGRKKSISPLHLWGLDYITPQSMKRSISPPELCKTGQITPYNSFEKS
jgi:hypothetical protein